MSLFRNLLDMFKPADVLNLILAKRGTLRVRTMQGRFYTPIPTVKLETYRTRKQSSDQATLKHISAAYKRHSKNLKRLQWRNAGGCFYHAHPTTQTT